MHWIPEPIPRGDVSNLPTHLSYDIDNPCARIYCRSGKLILDHDDESPTLSSIEDQVRREIAIMDQRKELFIPKSQDLRSGVTRNIENTIDPRLPQSPYQGETD